MYIYMHVACVDQYHGDLLREVMSQGFQGLIDLVETAGKRSAGPEIRPHSRLKSPYGLYIAYYKAYFIE